VREYISADQSADDILKAIRRQGALSIACHPHHRTTRRVEIGTCYLWDHRKRVAELVDVWEAANRDDLFSVTSVKHYLMWRTATSTNPEAPVLVENARAVREEVGVDRPSAQVERRCRADALSQRLMGGLAQLASSDGSHA
jgi:hypothetical protein